MANFEPTDEQKAIIAHTSDQHARVLAGPGTGKSTTMVALLDRLLDEDPHLRVRLLTFTRAATAELADKVLDHTDAQTQRPSTIHSFAISVLLQNPGTGGFPAPLRIADTWEYHNVVRPSLARRGRLGVRRLDRLVIEMAANWESLTEQRDPEIPTAERRRFNAAWKEHREIFGYTLLQELPYALHKALVHHDLEGIDFDLLLVDEYQDLNACDLDVLRLLVQKRGCTIVATGDDDQSVYSWRKAAPEGIRRFTEEYADAADYPLSVTIRCGKTIVEWANHVIEGDLDRPADRGRLTSLPDAPDGDVALLSFKGHVAETKGIARLVHALVEKGLKPSDILVLMRSDHNRAFSKPIRKAIEELGIPCSDPTYIIALLAEPDNRRFVEMLRLLVNPADSISWGSLLMLTPGIGQTFLDYIYERCVQNRSTFGDELLAARDDSFPDGPASSSRKAESIIGDVFGWIERHEIPDEHPDGSWGPWIRETVDSDVVATPTEEFFNLLEAIDGISEDEQGLQRYLAQIEPLGRDHAQAAADGIRIMTMAGSKGLTVRATIIAGVEEGFVPRPNAQLGEERRLLYVATTRTKEYLYITWARIRRGPTARQGKASVDKRWYSHFLEDGPVESQDGNEFINERF